MSSLSPDSIISHYKIKQLLGRGGMGEVYKAIDLRLGRLVALKTLPSTRAANQIAQQRFLREARAASSLSHPNICTVYEVGDAGNLTFIAMQYIEGKTIQQLLSESLLPVEAALQYALEIADALGEAHRRGVIHRDIKPSNIIVNERDSAVVLDFGLAKQIALRESLAEEASTQLQLTSEMTILGTPLYMSPEQARGERLDARSDIFSYGATLYEMLTGVSPFRRAQTVDVLHAIMHEEPKPVSEVRPHLGRDLNRIVQKCLAKDMASRYPSLEEVKTDLVSVIGKKRYKVKGVSTASDGTHQTASGAATRTASALITFTHQITSSIARFISSLGWREASVAVAAVVIVIGAWWAFRSLRRPSDTQLVGTLKYEPVINWKDQKGVLQDSYGVLSPDGMLVAYSTRETGNRSIWTKQLAGGNPRAVVNDEWNNWSPVWSPDGQEIAYISSRGGEFGVWHIPAFSGTPVKIVALESQIAQSAQLKRWAKDRRTLYFQTDRNLFSLDIAAGNITQLTDLDPSSSTTRHFSLSPAEDRVAYTDDTGRQSDLWVTSIKGGRPVRITNDVEEDLYPIWHPDGERIIYSSKRDDVFQVCVAYLDGRAPLQVTFGENDSFVSDVSSDGTKILYSGSREVSDIWAVNLDTGEESQVTSDIGAELWADVSPDGRRIAFQAVKQWSQSINLGKSSLLVRSLDANKEQIQLAADAISPRWSPDGRKVGFLRASESGVTLWSVNAVGGDERQLTGHSISGFAHSILPYNRFNVSDFSWSPDSSRISYCSEDPEPGLWVCSEDGQTDLRIVKSPASSTAFLSPLWSADGTRIAYLSKASGEKVLWSVCVADVKTGESKAIYQATSVLRLLGWGPDWTVFATTIEGKSDVWPSPAEVKVIEISFNGGATRQVASLPATYLYSMQLSQGGGFIAFVSRQESKGNIWVITTQSGPVRRITTNADPLLYFSSLTWSADAKRICFDKQSRNSLISMISNFK